MNIRKNDEITIRIKSVSNQGFGVGYPVDNETFSSFAVFVAKTAPGDMARVRIIKVKQGYAYGKVLEITEESPCRIESDCAAYGASTQGGCGGCCYRHINYNEELRIKQVIVTETLKRIGGTDLSIETIPSPEVYRYRNKAQFPFGISADGEPVLGIFAGRSHRLIETADCLLMPKEFIEIGAYILNFIKSNDLNVYNEETGTGLFRHLYIRKGWRSGEVLVCLVINGGKIPKEDILTQGLTSVFPSVKSIVVNINKKRTNVILGEDYRFLYGSKTLTDFFCGLELSMSLESFYQVNSPASETLYKKALDTAELSKGETVLDLFCGVGAIGLYFAKEAGVNVTGVEITKKAIENAMENAARNGIKNIEFIQADLSKGFTAELRKKPSVVIVDPPRKGLGTELVKSIATISPDKVLYISCDPGTLARDIKSFGEYGYAASKAAAVDLFPRTQHVECVVLLVK